MNIFKFAGSFQFLGIPPKGEPWGIIPSPDFEDFEFPISRDPPEGGTYLAAHHMCLELMKFPISRDPPEGGTTIADG